MSKELNKDTTEVTEAGSVAEIAAKIDSQDESIKVYELGFHFLPTIAEDEIPVQFSQLKSLIEKKGGEFIAEDFPKLRELAYELTKTIKTQKKRYNNAYFGWIKFTLEPDQIAPLEKDIKAFEPMLRYLLIKTVRENTLSPISLHTKDGKDAKDGKRSSPTEEAPAAITEAAVTAAPEVINDAEIDKSIDELIKE